MLNRFLNRPLTMSELRNTCIYAFLGTAINHLINSFWVTDSNPEGLMGFPGYALLFLSMGLCMWINSQENRWVREIKKSRKLVDR